MRWCRRTDRPPRRVAFLLGGFAMFGPFSIDAIFPGFPAIALELKANPVMMQQMASVYLAGFGLMSLFHGPLSDALGRRRIVLLIQQFSELVLEDGSPKFLPPTVRRPNRTNPAPGVWLTLP